MEQLSFPFLNTNQSAKTDSFLLSEDNTISKTELMHEANAIADIHLNISGMEALCMAVRGDFYNTNLEGSLLHSKLQRIAALLGM